MVKLFEFNSIRSRMVSGFLFLTFLIAVLAAVSLYIIERNNEITHLHSNINQLEILTLSLIKSDNDFFDLDATNATYFTTRQSVFLNKRDSLNTLIQFEMAEVQDQRKDREYNVQQNLTLIDSTIDLYNTTFKKLEYLLFKRGFKDYGIEGQMRLHAHTLEEKFSGIEISKLLYLRRNEKDFFLRLDLGYQAEFNKRSKSLAQELKDEAILNTQALYHLTEYTRLFNDLVVIQTQIGLSSQSGLRNELNNLTFSISKQYFDLAEFSYRFSTMAQKQAKLFFLVVVSGAILFSILSGLWISKKLSEPIAKLSKLVENIPLDKSYRTQNINLKNAAKEVSAITRTFIILMDQTKQQMSELRLKSLLLRKKNKQLKKVNKELDNFLYSTAHDLRSPLTSLLGLINLMRYENTQEKLNTYLFMMEKSIKRSENFISQIVNFSKNKRMNIHPEKLDMSDIINEILESQEFISGNERIRKEININENSIFYSDRNRIIIIFNNLISNAIRYADFEKEECFVKISIHINDEEATIEFADNGVGISEEHLDKIFNMFYRANIDSKGSGLGLFIFKETLTKLQGHASVESKLGVGTKFFIRLPNLILQMPDQPELQLFEHLAMPH